MIEIRSGKFGQYFHDTNTKEDLSLNDVRNRLNEKKKKLSKEEVFYKYGDQIKIERSIYILSLINCNTNLMCLINKKTGISMTFGSVAVGDYSSVTEDEMFLLTGGTPTSQITRIV